MFKKFSSLICVSIFLISGCSDGKAPREYQEYSSRPEVVSQVPSSIHDAHPAPMGSPKIEPTMSDTSAGEEALKRHVIHIWTEQDPVWNEAPLAKMSLVTLTPNIEGSGAQVTFTLLSGSGGGIQSNVMRWLRQLNLHTLPEDQVQNFLATLSNKVSSTGVSFTDVDFTALSTVDDEPSMLASMINMKNQTLFIKLSGRLSTLRQLKDSFFSKVSATAEMKGHDDNR